MVDGTDVVPEVHAVLDRIARFADAIRAGEWTGHTGRRIRHVVNIGIGGSDLGLVMAYNALRQYSARELTFRFASNVDGTDFVEAARGLDAEEARGLRPPRRDDLGAQEEGHRRRSSS